jgi:heterodisulfide reductase subunit A
VSAADAGNVGAVLVVGGGIAGIQSALDLAESGFKVFLVESSPGIGGIMAQLDKTFPTNDCAMCTISPRLVEVGNHRNIVTLRNTEVEGVTGRAGDFRANIVRKPCYVIEEKCTGCGLCAEHCPIDAVDEYNLELTQRRAAYILYPQCVPKKYAIDREKCIGCGLCKNRCIAGAIDFEQKEQRATLAVGAVIFAPGLEMYDPEVLGQFGYGRYPNVVTNMEFERLLGATGPFESTVLRLSDGQPPARVAFIQCVGSRDVKHNPYCSSICCTASVKQAVVARAHDPKLESAIFFMDERFIAKGSEEYAHRNLTAGGLRFIDGRVAEVKSLPDDDLLVVYANEDEKIVSERFNMVVLATSCVPPPSAVELAGKLGVAINAYRFCKTGEFRPLESSVPGIFVAGFFSEPKDIPDSVQQASGCAAKAGVLLSKARFSQVKSKEYPKEKDVSNLSPRIGVFVCHCGTNIGGVVRVPEIVEYARKLQDVVYAEANLFTCSTDTQERIRETIKKYDLNRVVVSSCTPRTHEALFREILRDAGLNPFLFEMANIRDQCSWVHANEPDKATVKSKDLLRMSVARARFLEPLYLQRRPLKRASCTVIGGGVAGITAALDIADQGFEVDLVERERSLGGNLRNISSTLETPDVGRILRGLAARAAAHPNIILHLGATVNAFEGHLGDFKLTLSSGVQVGCATIVVATGARESIPTEYMYGKDARILTQLEFEKAFHEDPASFSDKSVVMIQCVGSREPGTKNRTYCSRTCCTTAVRNALELLKRHPGSNVTVLHRDIRTYGFREDAYREARGAGALFVRYSLERRPEVLLDGGKLKVRVQDTVLGRTLEMSPDFLVLSSASVPSEGAEELSKLLKIPLMDSGFFLEAHMKLRPVDFASEGIFLAGSAHSPKFISEAISQASATAGRSSAILARGYVESGGVVAEIDPQKCAACLTCVRLCPVKAPRVMYQDKAPVHGGFALPSSVVIIEESQCVGCGICSAACPSKAIQLRHYLDKQVIAKAEALLMETISCAENGGNA